MDGRTAPGTAAMDTFRWGSGGTSLGEWEHNNNDINPKIRIYKYGPDWDRSYIKEPDLHIHMNLLIDWIKTFDNVKRKNCFKISKIAIERLVTKSYIISQGLMYWGVFEMRLHSPVFYLATCGRRWAEMERKQIKSCKFIILYH